MTLTNIPAKAQLRLAAYSEWFGGAPKNFAAGAQHKGESKE
jgi:hypothetical protein